ncbi:hypothetical protein Y032_0017g3273 [Ancylostoma ceylanicum]|uniref:RNA-directed DNA polymerase n=2 Tax=Ancylostoma ceylanicum TaxID=53326 RepID=A0A016V5L0_9BILA|nr:hypothetical protein Y032_0017g3273 [Ancylostoma ceylanicum]
MPSSSQAMESEQAPRWLEEVLQVQFQHLQLLQQQNQRIADLVSMLVEREKASTSAADVTSPAPRVDPYGDLVRDLPTFNYEGDEDETFNAWYTRYGPVMDDRGKALSDDRKRNLIVEKLDKATYKTYSEHVLPLKPQEIDLATTIDNLRKLFGPKRTLIRRRYEFLQSKCPPLNGAYVPYREYGNMIKRKFEDASMKDVDSDSLKCLVFLSGLTDPSHSETRLRLLNQLNRLKESDPAPLLDDFINECETFVTLRTDNRAIESKEVNAAYQRKPAKQDRKHPYSPNKGFRYRCQPRDRSLHSPSRNERSASPAKKRGTKRPKRKHRCKNIAASAHGARTYLKVRINGHPTRLQLDTGADITMISRRTWEDMKSPKLDRSTITIRTADGSAMNILGSFKAAFTIFDRKGRPTEGTGCCYVTESTDLLEYRKTANFGQADALSRLIAEQTTPSEDVVIAQAVQEAEADCRAITSTLPVDMKMIAEESANDDILKNVISYVQKDKWPHKPSADVARYFALRQSLAIQDDCLFFGPRIVIPSKLRRRVLQLLHDGHPGTTRMKMLARSYVYWTNITKDIEVYVRGCRNCQEVAKAPLKTELFSWPNEKQPWSRVHIDYAGPLNGKMFLVIVDAYSKWPEIIEMTSTTSAATIRQLTRLFAQFGNPTTLVSDNGSQFASKEFAEFCSTNGITHVRSPPFHPQSNGQAERFVDTFKRALEKLKDSGTTSDALQKFLQTYRRTPCPASPGGRSPAENFLGRQLRTPLTMLTMPKSAAKERNRKMESQFNFHNNARPKKFEPDDAVWVRNFGRGGARWTPGRVLARHGHATYDVLIDGRVHRRHSNQMRPNAPENSEKTLLDLFDLPILPAQTPTNTTPASTDPQAQDTTLRRPSSSEPNEDSPDMSPATADADTRTIPTPTPPRRSQRNRRPPIRLDVNPTRKTYRNQS